MRGDERSFEKGHAIGYDKGYWEKHDEGEEEGYDYGVFQGMREGQEKGFAEGREKELNCHLATARKLLARGMSREKVQELTGFSKKEMAML